MLNTNSWFTSPQPRLALETAREEPCCPAARLDVAEDYEDAPLPTEIFVPAADPPEQVMKPPYPLARRRDPFVKPRTTPAERSVALAREHRGQLSDNGLKKRLPNFRNAGGGDNNCADFVSAVLQDTGRLKGHYDRVPNLESALRHQGWRAINGTQAQPGDVWFSDSHTEIVTRVGGTGLIGSNNGRHSYQTITEHGQNPRQGTYYTNRPR